MIPTPVCRFVAVAALGISLSLGAAAQTGPAPALFSEPQRPADLRAGRMASRSRIVEVHTNLLADADRQPALTLALFPDAVYRATFQRIDATGPRQYVWQGRLDGITDGEATFAVTDGTVVGQVTLPGAQYRIRPAGPGVYTIEQIDTRRFPIEGEPLVPDAADLHAPDVRPGTAPDDGSLIDVMVVYTPAARTAAGGPSSIASLINLSIANSNNAYANSGVNQRLRLVHSAEVAYTESSSGMGIDLDQLRDAADGVMDGVHTLRNTYKADIVTLLTDATDYCGLGYVMSNVSSSFAPFAFNVVSQDCAAANLSFAHELGHNMGLQHDFANADFEGAYPYAYGYRDPDFFRTVMAYECPIATPCPRVQHFSTHTRSYGGRPTGVANESENARALNDTAFTTANFRRSVVCSFTLSQSNGNAPRSGGTRTVSVIANDPACEWTAASNSPFISVNASGTGSGTVAYTVGPNAGAPTRAGTIIAAGISFPIYQPGSRRGLATDFDSDGIEEIGVFRPREGRFLVNGRAVVNWGAASDWPVTADYNGDGASDYAVWRPRTGTWYVMNGPTVVWGAAGDVPVPGDYNGDGITEMAVFRPATMQWIVRNVGTFEWGRNGDLPVQADWDGDGDTDIAVYRPATGTWYVMGRPTTVWGAPNDIPVPADYNGDGRADIAVWRPSNGTWYVKDQMTQVWGAVGDVPVPLDRDADGRAELGVFRGTTARWYVLTPASGTIENVDLGTTGEIPLMQVMSPVFHPRWADFDGDRRGDLTVFRPSEGAWYSLRSQTSMTDYTVMSFGLNGDEPVAGDWDGDGINDPAVYRPSTQTWYAQRSSTGYADYISRTWGLSGDTPVPGDYDGDRRMDFAVFRPSLGRWVILLSSTGNASYVTFDFGLSGDIPVPADYDGDGRADIAVFRPSAGRWYVLDRFSGTYLTHDWGRDGDTPVPGDYDGDGRTDIAVYRPSTGRWFILFSESLFTSNAGYDFGLSTDVTVPADYDGDGRTDIAVFRPSTGRWFILNRFFGTYVSRDWGTNGDIPASKVPQ